MRTVRTLLAGCACLLLPILLTGCGGSNASRIVGKWEVAKAPEGEQLPTGAVFEFTRDGKLIMTAKIESIEVKMEGTYKVEGDKVTMTMKVDFTTALVVERPTESDPPRTRKPSRHPT